MVDEAARVLATPSDIASFQAFDLNLKQVPSKEMIFAPADLAACYVEELPDAGGTGVPRTRLRRGNFGYSGLCRVAVYGPL